MKIKVYIVIDVKLDGYSSNTFQNWFWPKLSKNILKWLYDVARYNGTLQISQDVEHPKLYPVFSVHWKGIMIVSFIVFVDEI